MTRHRAADVLFDSEAALRLVVSELAELNRRNTPFGQPSCGDDDRDPALGHRSIRPGSDPLVPDAA